MGNVLQIRVSAVTWNEDLLEKSWPNLVELAETLPLKFEKRGVLELVDALAQGLRFMDWPDEAKEKLAPGITKAASIKKALEDALAAWDPKEANKRSDELESVLDTLERM